MSLKKFLRNPFAVEQRYNSKLSLDDLINAESELGRTLFGPIPVGHQREFFESRKNIWIWHESWTDQFGNLQEMTVRYEVRPTGVYKKPTGGSYKKIEGEGRQGWRSISLGEQRGCLD